MESAFQAIEEQYVEATEKIYYKFGLYLKNNILNIPKDILFPEDAVHREVKCSGDDLKAAIQKLDNMCSKIKRAKMEKVG